MDSFCNGSGTGISGHSEPRETTAFSISQYVFLTVDTLSAFSLTAWNYKWISGGYIYYGIPMSDIQLLIRLGVINVWAEFLIMLYFVSLAISFLIFYGITHLFLSPLARKDWTKFSWAGFAVYFVFVFVFFAPFVKFPADQVEGLYPLSKVVMYIVDSMTAGVMSGMVLAKITNLVVKPLLRGYVVMLGVTLDNPKKRRFVLIKRKSTAIVKAVKEFWEKERDWIH